jgi:porphobilinogen synthase
MKTDRAGVGYPQIRLRRLRRTAALRHLLEQPWPGLDRFIWPVFVTPGSGRRESIEAMPGQDRMSVDVLVKALEPPAKNGLGGVLIFGLAEESSKDSLGAFACDEGGSVQQAVREIKKYFPDLVVCTDVCLCAYTNHGHCGPLTKSGDVDNDAAVAMLAKTAVSHAEAGADVVAPSAMMDGQVRAIRHALDEGDFGQTLIMSYSTKFASALYGPFREAERSAPHQGSREGYQTSYGNLRLALRESTLDEQEGADLLMVKPSLFYLDVLSELRKRTDLPIVAYNVSGEYSMLIAAAERGWGNLRDMVRECITALARAGADVIISYWANRYKEVIG